MNEWKMSVINLLEKDSHRFVQNTLDLFAAEFQQFKKEKREWSQGLCVIKVRGNGKIY